MLKNYEQIWKIYSKYFKIKSNLQNKINQDKTRLLDVQESAIG